LFTLGPEFETIQNNYRIGNLPLNWHTNEWPSILILCQDYYNSVKPQGITKRDSSNPNPNPNPGPTFDRALHQKKVKEWFLSPIKFCKEIADEQVKFSGKRLYHLTKSHQTCDCFILKDGDKTGSAPKPSTASATGQLRHVTEELSDEPVDDCIDDCPDEIGNNTNKDSLHYFARITKHYLRLVKSSNSTSPRHEMRFPIIADSGANYHMFKELEFFDTLVPATGKVILGDGKTSLEIKGIGTIKLNIEGHDLTVDNVRYTPELSESIYSLFLHVQCPRHGLTSSFEDGLHI
jgi:hypothetical protein